jgi:hypothetical protein
MATERQQAYLKDLGTDPRADLDDLTKEEASQWIEELKGYFARAGLPVGAPLTAEDVARLGVRGDALAQPPTRSPGANGNGGSARVASAPPALPSPPPPPSKPRSDESWVKIELTASVSAPDGETAVVTVSASEHHRHGASDEDAEELGEMARRFLEREVSRFHRAYVRSAAEE